MVSELTKRSGLRKDLMARALGLFLLGLSGCASEPPKPAPTVTPEQVRSHADQTFEKLEHEEQKREMDSSAAP